MPTGRNGREGCEHCGPSGFRRLAPKDAPYKWICTKCSRTFGDNPDFKANDELFATPIADAIGMRRQLAFERFMTL